MVKLGLLVRLDAKPGMEEEVVALLEGATVTPADPRIA
jgi:hypothetical protein